MMCTALARSNAPRDRITVSRGSSSKSNRECLRPVVPDIALSLCAVHLLLAVQTVEELGGREDVISIARVSEHA